jgi:hypothetical protein
MGYYKNKIPTLIEKLKLYHAQLEIIVGDIINDEIGDEKLLNVIKAKSLARTEIEIVYKEIERLQNIVNGTEENNNKVEISSHPTKKYVEKE